MASPQPSLWQRAIHFALGETVAQRCLQFAMLAPAAIWLRVRNMNAPWEGVLGKHIREGRKLDVDEKIKVQLWEAADICCVLLFVLVLLSPWWLRWANRKAVPQTPHKATAVSSSWRSRGWLCLWLVIAFAVRWNYMDRIILRDEQDTARRNILGYVIVDQPGKEGPIVLDCTDTLWEDQQANNPFLFSVLSRITQRTWQAVSGAEPWRLNLTLLRLGALVPGLLSLAAIWWSL
ncbi:MAG TPA: hypothetical protein VLE43_02900, partial [Candidatus Saccharimonadia bacterium]|nr:hypothetical protein [Candidatus Saccharimonadia bacterium]